jgi:hypothetical protein
VCSINVKIINEKSDSMPPNLKNKIKTCPEFARREEEQDDEDDVLEVFRRLHFSQEG